MPVWQLLLEPKLTLWKTEREWKAKKDCSFFSFGAVWDVICFLGDCVQPRSPWAPGLLEHAISAPSLSVYNDSPCSPLLMFVIALSHKGGWSMKPSRTAGVRGSPEAVCPPFIKQNIFLFGSAFKKNDLITDWPCPVSQLFPQHWFV